MKLFFLTSHPMSMVVFMLPHLRALKSYWRLHVLANTQEADLLQKRGLDLPVEFAPVERQIRLLADIKALCDCDAIALMPGWENSKGAHLELHIAHRIGLKVYHCDALTGEYLRCSGDPASCPVNEQGDTCDMPLCERCATEIGPDKHLCPKHKESS